MFRPHPYALALCALAPAALIAQQQPTATLSGTVTDPAGAALVGATLDASPDLHTQTDASGRFTLRQLPAGPLTLTVHQAGFQDRREALTLLPGQDLALNLALAVAPLATAVNVEARPGLLPDDPAAQTATTISRSSFRNTPATTVADILELVPGVTFVQGNGPRDVSVSVRGSNERQTYGIRNIQVSEDGFPVTQPDGLARTDLTDPHAYSSVDVIEGPSSALFGNYATGGALNFHTRSGSEIQGVELGADFASFGTYNDFLTAGTGNDHFQVAGFVSNLRSAGFTANNRFNTITANLLGTISLTSRDRLTLKFINNDLDTDLSLRLSFNQFALNPFQAGCTSAAGASAGCATVSLYTNGFNGMRQSLTAAQAGLGRHDRRTITGARWEHDLSPATTWQTQFVWDNRDINQPTSATTFRGTYPSFNVLSGLVRRGPLLGRTATTTVVGSFNYENINSQSSNLTPAGHATVGGLLQVVNGKHLNTGGRIREEFALAERWTLVAGLGLEFTSLNALAENTAYPIATAPSITPVNASRTFFNAAPEVGLQFRPVPAIRLHTRLGTGYGTPQATQLFTNAQGQFGNNTTLQTQRNLGVELGADWTVGNTLQATVTGFGEWFHNEQVTQSPGVNLQSYTFNAPASRHAGMEAALDLEPLPHGLSGLRLRASYLLDNQRYTRYTEQLTTGAVTAAFSRAGNRIPGVQPHDLNGRILYDQPTGPLRGFGAFLEANWRDNYVVDNANLLAAPGYTLLNLSTHYDPPAGHGALSRLRFLFDIDNLTNRLWVSSASNLTDSLSAAGLQNPAAILRTSTGVVYAGSPRATTGGVRVRF